MADNGWTVQKIADLATDTFKYQVTTADVKRLIPSIYLKAPKDSPVTEEEAGLVMSALASKAGEDYAKESEEGPLPEEKEEGIPSAPGGMLAKFEQAEAVGLSMRALIGWLEGADKWELRRAGHFWFGLDPANTPRSLKQNMIAKVENWATDPTGFDPEQLPDFDDDTRILIEDEIKKRIAAADERKKARDEAKKAQKQVPKTIELPAELDPPTNVETWEDTLKPFDVEEDGDVEGDTQPTPIPEEVIEDLEEIPSGGEVEEEIPDKAEIEEEPQPESGQTETEPTQKAVVADRVKPKSTNGDNFLVIAISWFIAGLLAGVSLVLVLVVLIILIIT